MPSDAYSVDSSALIHAWRRVYRPKNFAFVWAGFDRLIEQSRLHASIEVYLEIEKRDDELFKWCKDRKESLFREINDDVQNHVIRIMRNHPRLVDTAKGRSAADPFVIALAATSNPAMIVVTEEHPGKSRIPDVCKAEAIQCYNLADLIEREDWRS